MPLLSAPTPQNPRRRIVIVGANFAGLTAHSISAESTR
jgi:predicted NAD/FAD-binding protein